MTTLQGVMTAIVTPFDSGWDLDLSPLPAFLEFQRRAGMDGVVVCGTNGEAVSMSVDERKRYLEAVMERRGGFHVVAGTGAASISDAVELTRHAGRVGADAVLVLPPFFFKDVSARGIADWYRRIMDVADLPVLLYSIPRFSAVTVTDDILDMLSGHPRLAGLKDSGGVWERAKDLIAGRPGLAIYPGFDDGLARGLAAGAPGGVSGTANCFPDLIAGIYAAHRRGEGIEAAQARLDQALEIVQKYPLIAVSKSVLARRGLPKMHVRPPLVDLTRDQESALITELEAARLPLGPL